MIRLVKTNSCCSVNVLWHHSLWQDFDESGEEFAETLTGFDLSPLKTESSSTHASKAADLPRDPDPMFNTSMSQKSELQSYIAEADAIAGMQNVLLIQSNMSLKTATIVKYKKINLLKRNLCINIICLRYFQKEFWYHIKLVWMVLVSSSNFFLQNETYV